MYRVGYKLVCKNRNEYLKKAFGIIRRSFNWCVSLGDYRLLIIPIYDNIDDCIRDVNNQNRTYWNYFANNSIVERNNKIR